MSAADDVKAWAVTEAERRWDGRPSGRVMRTGFLDTFVAGAEWAAGFLTDPDALARAKAEALREAAGVWVHLGGQVSGAAWLRDRADRIDPTEGIDRG